MLQVYVGRIYRARVEFGSLVLMYLISIQRHKRVI